MEQQSANLAASLGKAPRTPRGEPACVVPSSPPGMPPAWTSRDPNRRTSPFEVRRVVRRAEIRSAAVPAAPYTGRSEKRGWGRVAAYAAQSDPGTV